MTSRQSELRSETFVLKTKQNEAKKSFLSLFKVSSELELNPFLGRREQGISRYEDLGKGEKKPNPLVTNLK